MKRLFWIVIFSLFSMAGFSQDIFEGISGLKFLSTDTLEIKNVFVWQGDTIRKDSIVYADINNDCIRFHYIDGNWTKWFCNSDIEKVVNHVHNDQDTIKTNELITNVTFQNDTLKIIEQGFTWKVKIQNVETDPVFNSWNKDYNDLTNKPTLFSGSYNDLTNKPTLFDGNYNSLTNKPTLFDGAYSSLTGKPTLLSQFTNDPGFLTSYTETDPTIYSWAKASTKPSYTASEVSALPNNATVTINGATKNLSTNPSFSISGGNAINAFYNQIAVSSNPISVTWPSSMGDTNYFLNIRAWYDNTVSGKTVQIANAVYDFTKTANGFSMSLDTIAGYVEYFAADTTNLYPMSFSNYLTPNDVVTTVGNPGADNKVPSEQAVREALSSFVATETDPVYTASSWYTTTNNSSNWNTAYGWGNHAGLYLQLSGGSLTGNLTFTNDNNGVNFYGGAKVYKRSGSGITIKRDSGDTDPYIENYAGTSWYKLWHEGNDGSGSGLDADLLDGQHSSYFTPTNDSRLSDTRVPTNATVTYSKVGIDLASSGTVTSSIDLSSKSIGYITLSGNTAFSFSNYQLGKTYILIVTANGYTPSFATLARHVFVNGNETLDTVGVFYIYLTCIDATTGSEKLLTTIMKGA